MIHPLLGTGASDAIPLIFQGLVSDPVANEWARVAACM